MAIFQSSKHNVILMFAQIIILLVCVGYIKFIYYHNILPDKEVATTFNKTNCLVSNKQMLKQQRIIPKYRADFSVMYKVEGKQYTANVSGNGLDNAFNSNFPMEENTLNQFNRGQVYPCWYDPRDPQKVILVLRHDWSDIFHLFIPAVLFLLMCYYFIRTLAVTIGITKHPRKIKK